METEKYFRFDFVAQKNSENISQTVSCAVFKNDNNHTAYNIQLRL